MSGRNTDTTVADSGETGSVSTPWWRRPMVIGTASAVFVTVVTGWAGQGGNALYETLFGGEEPTRPIVTVSSADSPMCARWLLGGSTDAVTQKISAETRKIVDSSTDMEQYRKDIDENLRRALTSTGSSLANGSRVDVTIQGNKDKAVVLESMEANVSQLSKLGNFMDVGSDCGGGFPNRFFSVDLDAPRPAFYLSTKDDNGKEVSGAIDFPFQVSSIEPERFILVGNTKSVAKWTATLHWVADGKRGETKIDDNGKPFVSFPNGLPAPFYNTSTHQLTPAP